MYLCLLSRHHNFIFLESQLPRVPLGFLEPQTSLTLSIYLWVELGRFQEE